MEELSEAQPTSIPNWSVRSGSAVVSLAADEDERERGRTRPRRSPQLALKIVPDERGADPVVKGLRPGYGDLGANPQGHMAAVQLLKKFRASRSP